MAVIKQYVNLEPDPNNKDYGNTRTVKVAPDQLKNVQPTDRIEWWAETVGNDNVPNLYIDPALRPQFDPPFSPLTGPIGNQYFETTFKLPQVGGNEYQIKACKQVDNRDPKKTVTLKDTIQTWRKLYYTLYHMGITGLANFKVIKDKFEEAFKECFVEFNNVAQIKTLRIVKTFDADPYNGVFLDGSSNAIIDLKPCGSKGTLSNKPFHLALLIVPDFYFTLHSEEINKNIRDIKVSSVQVPNEDIFFNPADPLSFIRSATISWPGYSYNVRDKFTYLGNNQVDWDFTSVPGLTTYLATPGNNFNIKYILVRKMDTEGYNMFKTNFCIIRTKDSGRYGSNLTLQTFTHETGHALQQVVDLEKTWDEKNGNQLSPKINPHWHNDDYGGIGSHCSTNAILWPSTPDRLISGTLQAKFIDTAIQATYVRCI
jgi:hypothetical protein